MALVTKMPPTFEAARTMLEQQAKIIGVLSRNSQGSRRRPQPVRNLISQPASLGAILTWNAPVKLLGIVGFRIYKDAENNLFEEVRDPLRRQYRIALPANTKAAYYVSSITAQGAESPKIPVLAISTGDQLVASGGTNGSQPGPPPSWNGEPSGGSTCFSGNVRVLTSKGLMRFEELPEDFEITNPKGKFQAKLIKHLEFVGPMLSMGEYGMVTPGHRIQRGKEWVPAKEIFLAGSQIDYGGTVYNMQVLTEIEEAHCYVLENGFVAHNIRKT